MPVKKTTAGQDGDDYAGARYDDIKKLVFEVQCRTIVMEAWANISHHLAYKGETSIPPHLRRDFFALSGLFYVADQHFELFFKEAADAGKQAVEIVHSSDSTAAELILDTLTAYLVDRFPQRRTSARAVVSALFQELERAGYTSLSEVDRQIDMVERLLPVYDQRYRVKTDDLNRVGAVRVALSIADDNFAVTWMTRPDGSRHPRFSV